MEHKLNDYENSQFRMIWQEMWNKRAETGPQMMVDCVIYFLECQGYVIAKENGLTLKSNLETE